VDEEEGFMEGGSFGKGKPEGGVVGAEVLLELAFHGAICRRRRRRGRRRRGRRRRRIIMKDRTGPRKGGRGGVEILGFVVVAAVATADPRRSVLFYYFCGGHFECPCMIFWFARRGLRISCCCCCCCRRW